jgi:hypothetical protein
MNKHLIWAIAAIVALAVVVLGVSTIPAQRPEREMKGIPPQVGRFVVASAVGNEIYILDTVTGQLYRWYTESAKRASEIPKVVEGVPPPAVRDKGEKGKRPDRPVGKERDKIKAKDPE